MALIGRAWEFRQTGPPNKVITLNDYQAPFGRLRKQPVFPTHFKLRSSEQYYGGLRIPDRSIFGDKEEPVVLRGRWSDKYLGEGGAVLLWQNFKQFVADAVQVTVKWGQIVAYVGLLDELKVDVEDNANLAWELTFKPDEDLALTKQVPTIDGIPQSPKTSAGTIGDDLDDLVFRVANVPLGDDMLPSFFDQLESLINALRNAEAGFYDATADFQDYTSATNAQIGRLLGTVSSLETAVQNVQDAIDTASVDGILYARTAETDFAWIDYKLNNDLSADNLHNELAQMSKQCQLATQGQNTVTTRAQDGDTWESISNRVYGQPDGAATLRSANGITYGQQPIPGQTYNVPLTATDF